MKLIAGLGNPGAEYARTRHNIGFIMADHLCYHYDFNWSEKKRFKAEVAEGEVGSERIALIKPLTHMNASGESLRAAVDFYKLTGGDVLIIHDDADMDFGKARIVQAGNDGPAYRQAGGHKGIISLYQHGLKDVWRLKIGVANARRKPGQAIDFVLTRFEPEEWDQLSHLAETVIRKADNFIAGKLATETFTWL